MESYSVKKRFSRKYTINGMDYFYEVQPNQVIQGTPTTDGKSVRMPIRIANRPLSFFIPITNLIQQITGYSQKQSSMEGTKPSIFTTKNIVMGVVSIALIYGLLKLTKIIK
jgi:hypothetical protein